MFCHRRNFEFDIYICEVEVSRLEVSIKSKLPSKWHSEIRDKSDISQSVFIDGTVPFYFFACVKSPAKLC